MEASLFSKYKVVVKSKATERGEIMKEILVSVNKAREGTTFKPYDLPRLGMKVSHIPTTDMYHLLSICKDAGNRSKNYHESFSKKFFYEIKPTPKT